MEKNLELKNAYLGFIKNLYEIEQAQSGEGERYNEDRLYRIRLQIIEKILKYEEVGNITARSFLNLANEIENFIEENEYPCELGFRRTNAIKPSYIANIIRYYHSVDNHIYFNIKYSKKEEKYKLHYSFFINGKEVVK
jgi:hypothetical protein